MVDRLTSKIIIYSTSLVLLILIIFSVSSIVTIMTLKRYSLRKVENVFKENADENLQREVVSYARILKGDMDAKRSVSFMFGEVVERILNSDKGISLSDVENIYGEINNVLDLRDVAIFNGNGRVLLKYPTFVDVSELAQFIEILKRKPNVSKINYFDFHINKDDTVSFTFVYIGKKENNEPVYIAFDYNPYDFYALVKTAQLYPYSQKYLWIINKDGYLIYDPPTKEHPLITLLNKVNLKDPKNGEALANIVKNYILKGKTGIARYTFRGVDKFVGYTYVKEFGWGLGLTLPVDIFYKPIKDLNRDINDKTTFTLALFGLFSSIIVLIAISASLLMAKRVVKPINDTVLAVESILSGDYSIRLPKCGMVELDELAEAVNRLMDYFEKSEK